MIEKVGLRGGWFAVFLLGMFAKQGRRRRQAGQSASDALPPTSAVCYSVHLWPLRRRPDGLAVAV